MTNDLEPQTITETDEVVERILNEWQWLDEQPNQRKERLRKQQTELQKLRAEYTDQQDKGADAMHLAELREHITVLEKKLRRGQREVLQEMYTANEQ